MTNLQILIEDNESMIEFSPEGSRDGDIFQVLIACFRDVFFIKE